MVMGPSDDVVKRWKRHAARAGRGVRRRPRSTSPGLRKRAVPTATTFAPADANSRQSWAQATPPMPTMGSPVTARQWKIACRATGLTAGPERPPPPPPRSGCSVSRSIAIPRTVLISTSPARPALGGGQRDGRDVGDARRQLGQQRQVGLGPAALEQRPRLGRVGADRDAAGVDVGAGHVQLERGHGRVRADPPHGDGVLLPAPAAHAHDQRHAQLGQPRQVLVAEPVEARVGEPDRVDHALRRLGDALRRVACARVQRDGLGDEGGHAEGARRQRVQRARAVQHRMGEVDPAEAGGQATHRAPPASTRPASSTGPSTQSRFHSPSISTAHP